jgi:photosystem II stability/assembly factor-like uncharacterized protein
MVGVAMKRSLAVSFLLLCSLASAQESEDLIRRRDAWFYAQRAYPLGYIPAGARVKAIEEMERMTGRRPLTLAAGSRVMPNASAQWKLIGPQPISFQFSGRVTALVPDPRNNGIIYLGSAQGGVWKSTDEGFTWTPITDSQASLAIGCIALDPSNPDIVYAGTGEQNVAFVSDPLEKWTTFNYFSAGILKSSDGGATWTQLASNFFSGPLNANTGGATIGALSVWLKNGKVLLAGVQGATAATSGIYRSADGGVTWTNVLSGAAGTEVFFDPSGSGLAYAALGSADLTNTANGVYRSSDAGQSWTRISGTGTNVLPSSHVGRIALAQAPSDPATLYASLTDEQNNGASLGLFKTTDGGQNWTALTTPNYCPYACDYSNVIRVDPLDANIVYVGGVLLFYSTDGGATWNDANNPQTHVDFHAVAFASGQITRLLAGNDGGVYASGNFSTPGMTWTTQFNETLAITQFYSGLSIDPTNVNRGFGGTQDNGLLRFNGSLRWEEVTGGDIGATVVDFTNPSTVYASVDCAALKSTANGNPGTFSSVSSGISTFPCGFLPPIVMDPSDSQTLYFGTQKVYQTTSAAATWTAISPDLTGCGFSNTGCSLDTIAVASSNANTVYAASNNGKVQVTTNALAGAGAVWTDISNGLPPRSVTQIAVDPANDRTAYVVFSGFSGFVDAKGHVFRTKNLGNAWTDISANLPNIPVNAIVVDPDLPGTLYIGTDIGVFATFDGGVSWSPFGSGLPRVAVTGLTFHRPSRTLRVGTYGRSAWDVSVPAVVSPTLMYYLRQDANNASKFGTISSSGAVNDQFSVGNNFDALTFTTVDVGYGPGLFYYLRHDASGFSTFGTISITGAVTDRFGVGYRFDALTFSPDDLGYGINLFYYVRHDTNGHSTFGTISTSGAVTDRFGVGSNFNALVYAPKNVGYGKRLFYYLRTDPATGSSTFGTISTNGAVVDRFVVGARFDALTFTHTDLGYGHDLFYYVRHDVGNGFSTFGTIATSGAIVDRFGVGFRFNAIATGSP